MRTIKKIIKKTIGVLFLVLLIIGGVIGYKGYERYKEVLEKVPLQEKIAEIRQKPSYTEIEDLPQIYLDAVVAVEDKRFYHHPGIDPMSIARAVRNDIRARALIEGGSTITQQLAKNMYFGQEQSLNRKVAEGMLALKLEWNYTKEEILELYVNSIYFGDGYYCVEEASYGYFGKPPSEMTAYESTMLAGIPNAPSAYAPTVSMELAEERQKKVLESMVREKYLTEEEALEIQNSKVSFWIDDEPKSGLARDLGDCLQSRNVPFGTSGVYTFLMAAPDGLTPIL